jgi:segregation and condensation protein A
VSSRGHEETSPVIGVRPPRVTVEGFEGPLDMLLELVEEKKLDILSVRLGDLAAEYLARVRALGQIPADEAAAFLWLASRLVLLKARSLLPSLEPLPEGEGEAVTEEELRARLLEYAAVRQRAAALGDRLRAGERAFHREGGTVDLPPRGGDTDALAAAWSRVLALAQRPRHEEAEIPPERYSVEQRTAEIAEIIAREGSVAFATLLGQDPSLSFAVVTFIALLDLYRRLAIDLQQDELFGEIRIVRKEAPAAKGTGVVGAEWKEASDAQRPGQ